MVSVTFNQTSNQTSGTDEDILSVFSAHALYEILQYPIIKYIPEMILSIIILVR